MRQNRTGTHVLDLVARKGGMVWGIESKETGKEKNLDMRWRSVREMARGSISCFQSDLGRILDKSGVEDMVWFLFWTAKLRRCKWAWGQLGCRAQLWLETPKSITFILTIEIDVASEPQTNEGTCWKSHNLKMLGSGEIYSAGPFRWQRRMLRYL